jgi:hypothetical protein
MVRLAVHNRLKLLVAVLRSHYASEFAEWPCRFAAVQVQLVRALQVHPEISGHAKILAKPQGGVRRHTALSSIGVRAMFFSFPQ